MDIIDIAIANGNTKKTLEGQGAIRGKDGSNCQFDGAVHDDASKSTKITLVWKDEGNVRRTSIVSLPDGRDGRDGVPKKLHVYKDSGKTYVLVDEVVKAIVLDGVNGKSAYEVAVANGYSGSKAEWLLSLEGQDGRGIASFAKTATAGMVDTYTLTYTDGTTQNINVVNGTNIKNVSELENDAEYITKTADNLVNYYLKSSVYTKDEMSELLRNLGAGMSLKVVDLLPIEDISATTIYLVKIAEVSTQADYVYKDNMWVLVEDSGLDTSGYVVNEVHVLPGAGVQAATIYRLITSNSTYAQYARIGGQWANLGSTGTNLADYYTRSQTEAKIAEAIADALANALADYAKKDELGDAAFSNSYNDLDDLPELPDMTAYDTRDLSEQKYATKEDLQGKTQIDDATTSATKTWSSQKTNSEIAKARIVDVADRAAYEQIRYNPNQYDAEKFYAFPEGDSLCIMHGDKEITGKPVKQTYDPTSVEPISGAGVAEALSTLREGYAPIEIKVGETQSGKPVYKQSYVMNGLSFNNVGNVNIGGFVHNLSQMESVERISGVLNRYHGREPLFSQSVPNNEYTAIRFTRRNGSNSLVLTATSWAVPSGYSLRDSFITLEYTKLTD